jgi:hypothetical protein
VCPIIDFLIHKFQEYVDMFRNISLCVCADQVKFAMTYKDFNNFSNYSGYQETPFKLQKNILRRRYTIIICKILLQAGKSFPIFLSLITIISEIYYKNKNVIFATLGSAKVTNQHLIKKIIK